MKGKAILLLALFTILFATQSSATLNAFDVNVTRDGDDILIVWTPQDTNAAGTGSGYDANIYYGYTPGATQGFGGTSIINDLNMSSATYCTSDNNFLTNWDWNAQCMYRWEDGYKDASVGTIHIDVNVAVTVPGPGTDRNVMYDQNAGGSLVIPPLVSGTVITFIYLAMLVLLIVIIIAILAMASTGNLQITKAAVGIIVALAAFMIVGAILFTLQNSPG